jgi:hypothetical protein
MPHDHCRLVRRPRELWTLQRFNLAVIHNYFRDASHFSEYLSQRDILRKRQRRHRHRAIFAALFGSSDNVVVGNRSMLFLLNERVGDAVMAALTAGAVRTS